MQASCLCLQVADAVFEVVEGDPRNVLCEKVEKYHADVLVVGSHGYGAIKRFITSNLSIASESFSTLKGN